MTAWTEGYVADIPYALGFYRETVPAHISFAAICVGRDPGAVLSPKRVLELGFGMGLGFVINAAANPSIHFEGVDFNPLHVAHACGLAEAAQLTNVTMREASFQDVDREANEGQHDVDLIVLHGILTWVSAEAHEAIVEIARKRLRPGGMLYVSYNCMPGWASVLPMQRLMRENAKRFAGRSDQQTASGLELVQALIDEKAGYFQSNPNLTERVNRFAQLDKNYLSHEYLNANWFIFYFADVAEMFGRAKLSYVASATLIENIDALSVPAGTQARVSSESDPIFKETLRDIASNKQFRRDVYARGAAALNPNETTLFLMQTRFALAVARNKVSLKFASALGELDGNAEIYGPILDLLDSKHATFAEISGLPPFAHGGVNNALQAIGLLVSSGQILPIPFSDTSDFTNAQRLNRVIIERMLQGRTYNFLAAPSAGSGIQTSHGDLLLLAAIFDGHEDSLDNMANYVTDQMKRLGINWVKDGKPITTDAERAIHVREEASVFLAEKLPLWRRLGIL